VLISSLCASFLVLVNDRDKYDRLPKKYRHVAKMLEIIACQAIEDDVTGFYQATFAAAIFLYYGYTQSLLPNLRRQHATAGSTKCWLDDPSCVVDRATLYSHTLAHLPGYLARTNRPLKILNEGCCDHDLQLYKLMLFTDSGQAEDLIRISKLLITKREAQDVKGIGNPTKRRKLVHPSNDVVDGGEESAKSMLAEGNAKSVLGKSVEGEGSENVLGEGGENFESKSGRGDEKESRSEEKHLEAEADNDMENPRVRRTSSERYDPLPLREDMVFPPCFTQIETFAPLFSAFTKWVSKQAYAGLLTCASDGTWVIRRGPELTDPDRRYVFSACDENDPCKSCKEWS
jgi:hypothetical protein